MTYEYTSTRLYFGQNNGGDDVIAFSVLNTSPCHAVVVTGLNN